MGMDLVGAGFTRRSDVKCSVDALDALIDAIPDEKINDESWINAVDPSGGMGWNDEDGSAFPESVRDSLKAGAREYDSALSGHRSSMDFDIQGTPLEFVWVGGDSWGDDPFEGFTELCYFINLASIDNTIGEAAAYVCGGLPNALTVAHFGGYV